MVPALIPKKPPVAARRRPNSMKPSTSKEGADRGTAKDEPPPLPPKKGSSGDVTIVEPPRPGGPPPPRPVRPNGPTGEPKRPPKLPPKTTHNVGSTGGNSAAPPRPPKFRESSSNPLSSSRSGVGGSANTDWNPANAKAAPLSKNALKAASRKGPIRPPPPEYSTSIARPVRNAYMRQSKMARASKSLVAAEVDDDDGDGGYFALPTPKRRSQALDDDVSGGASRKLRTYTGRSKNVSERTKEGFLHKKGGKTGAKGWDKRWFLLSDGNLKYFKDRDKAASGIISVSSMVDIRPTTSSGSSSAKHAFRFELDTPERTYYLSADTVAEMTEWMMLIGALIQANKSSEEADTVGGSMANANKVGWIQIRGNDFRQTWHRRYLAIKGDTMCFYEKYDDFVQDSPLHRINFLFVNVKAPAPGSKKESKNQFQILTNGETFECRAESKGELKNILDAIQTGVQYSYSQMDSDKKSDVENIPKGKALGMMQENKSNMICADCSASKPDWASINLGILFCKHCCGIHRSLGVHVSVCRSCHMDEWNETLIGLIVGIGNAKSNSFWEGSLPDGIKPTPTATMEERKSYISAKYVERKYCTFRNPVEQYSIVGLKTNMKSDDLLLTLEHIICGVGPNDPNASSVIAEADIAGNSLQMELLGQNGFKVSEENAEYPREQVQIVSEGGELTTCWSHVVDCELQLFYAEGYSEPKHTVPVGMIRKINVDDRNLEVTIMDGCNVNGSQILTMQMASADAADSLAGLLKNSVVNLPSQALDFATCSKTGTLQIIGADGAPQKPRFFAVRDRQLRYFTSENDADELGCVDLRSVRSIVDGLVDPTMQDTIQANPDCLFTLTAEDAMFILCASTEQERLQWLSALRATQVFGATLDNCLSSVTLVVDQCCTYLEAKPDVYSELYACSGNQDSVDMLRASLNRSADASVLQSDQNVHDVASVIQLFLMELPSPLVSPNIFSVLAEMDTLDFEDIGSHVDVVEIRREVSQLPSASREILIRLCRHILRISETFPVYAPGMSTSDRLCCVFGPLFFGIVDEPESATVAIANCGTKLFIQAFTSIFE